MSPINVRIDLNPGESLYRGKLFLRTRKDIQVGVVELPSIGWKIDRNEMQGIDDQTAVKSFIRYIAHAGESVAKSSGDDLTFVGLILVKSTPPFLEFALRCPHPQLVSRMRAKRDLWNLPKPQVEIHHKYQIAFDVWTPVVFVFDRSKEYVLVTNQNHFSNPRQFLEVVRCKETSGFLNFFGTLSIIHASDSSADYWKDVGDWVQTAVHEKCDEWLRWIFKVFDDQAVSFAFDRILVDPENPERWFFDYSGNEQSGGES